MLKRKAYNQLLKWKNQSKGATALLIEGARRVGKSTLVLEFGNNEYASVLLIDFNLVSDEVLDYFEDFRTDFDSLFLHLSTYYGVTLHERDTLVIFDEVQMYPRARSLIKYLVADGRYDYIETGSLLSIKQNVKDIVLPSEEDVIELNPLDFEEFLWAMNEKHLAQFIKDRFISFAPLSDGLHKKAQTLFRQYMLVGGMPEPVQLFANKREFEIVDKTKRQILTLYRNDVGKFAKGYERKVASILDGIPGQLSKHEKKFTLNSLSKDARMRNYEDAFFWLEDARIANICFGANDPSVGLSLNLEQTSFKCYMADTGLLVTLAFADKDITEENVYRSVLRGNIGINEGMLTENVVAQMLHAAGHKLFFYSESGKNEGDMRMEIDFLITKPYKNAANKPRVCPIEVKSPRQYGLTSLNRFSEKFGKRIGSQYVLHTKQLKVEEERIFLPIYMAFCL